MTPDEQTPRKMEAPTPRLVTCGSTVNVFEFCSRPLLQPESEKPREDVTEEMILQAAAMLQSRGQHECNSRLIPLFWFPMSVCREWTTGSGEVTQKILDQLRKTKGKTESKREGQLNDVGRLE